MAEKAWGRGHEAVYPSASAGRKQRDIYEGCGHLALSVLALGSQPGKWIFPALRYFSSNTLIDTQKCFPMVIPNPTMNIIDVLEAPLDSSRLRDQRLIAPHTPWTGTKYSEHQYHLSPNCRHHKANPAPAPSAGAPALMADAPEPMSDTPFPTASAPVPQNPWQVPQKP